MASNIKFKRSSVQNRVPTTAQLELGELALNTYDGKLYTEINTGSAAVVEIGSKLSSLVVDGDNGGGNGDVTFHGATAGRDLLWDASANRLEFADNAIASWGSSADLRIYHDSNHSYVSDYGTGNLRLTGSRVDILNSSANETMISCIEDAEVLLYHNNNIRVTTTDDGADISGTGSLKIPVGTTAQRSASPTAGDLRYNTTTGGFEGYSTDWGEIGAGGVGVGSTSINPGSGVMGARIGVGFTDINFVGAGLSVTGYGSTVVVDISDAVSRRYGRNVYTYTATEGQTTFTGLSYTNATIQISVYLNGARLSASAYTATSGNTVVLATGASVGDNVEILELFSGVDLSRTLHSFTATAGQTTFTGLSYLKKKDLDVYLNGIRLSQTDYTATDGGSIVLSLGASVNDLIEVIDMGAGATWSVGGTEPEDVYRLDGGVGIGTSNPTDKLNVIGNARVVGILTVGTGSVTIDNTTVKTGTSNLHNVGIEVAGINVLGADTPIGVGATIYNTGGALFAGTSGIVTATAFHGDGSQLTGIDATKIITGNTQVQTIDTGSDGHVKVLTEGSERLRIDSGGRLLLNTTTEGHGNADDLTIATAAGSLGNTGITIRSSTTGDGNIFFSDATSGDGETKGVIKYAHDGDHMQFNTGGSERLRITSAGQALVGTTSNRAINAHAPRVQISGTSYSTSTVSLVNNAADATGAYLFFTKQRSGSAGGSTAVAQDDIIGDIRFTAGDGTDVETGAARITVVAESNAGSNSVPSYMRFSTTATTTPVERLRIASDGKIGIGCDPDYTLDVRAASGDVWVSARGGTNQGFQVRKADNTLRGYAGNGAGVNLGADDFALSAPAGNLVFQTGGTASSNERLRIDSGGRLLLGTTTEGHAEADNFTIGGSGSVGMTIRSTDSNSSRIYFSDATSGNGEQSGALIYRHSTNALEIYTNEAERLRIDADGRILAGTTSSSTNTRAIIQGRSDNAATTGTLHLQRGAANPNANSGLGKIIFADNASAEGAYIWAQAESNWASGDYPTMLKFATTPDAGGNATPRLTITSTGRWIQGASENINMDNNASGQLTLDGQGYKTGFAMNASGLHIYHNAIGKDIIFGPNETEKMRLYSNGNLNIAGDVTVNGDELFIADSIKHIGDTDTAISFPSNDTIRFNTGGSARVTVTDATTTVANNLTVTGNLQIDGTTTTVNSATMTVDDKNIVLGSGAANDAAADGGGITLESGDGNKTWNWVDSTDAWTSSEHIHLGDDKRLFVGAGSDFSIRHTGTDTIITNATGDLYINNTGASSDDIIIKAKDDINIQVQDGETAINCIGDGAVELYYDNVKTFETTGLGIKVSGPEGGNSEIELFADEGDDNNDKWKILTNSNGNFYIQNYGAGSYQNILLGRPQGTIELYHGGNKKLETTSSGIAVTGDADISGTVKVGNNNSHFSENNVRFNPAGHAYIDHGTTSQSIYFRVSNASSNDTNALIIGPTGNATFAATVTANNVYANDWFRNNGTGEGLYNTGTDAHFYSAGNQYWHINGNSGDITNGGLVFYDRYQSTHGDSTGRQGYVYWDSNGFGLLHSGGNWTIRGNSSNTDLYGNLRQGASNTIWHAGNDGSGSGLDADKLDGSEATKFFSSYDRTTTTGWEDNNRNFRVNTGTAGAAGIAMHDSAGTFQLQLYGASANSEYGFLTANWGSWDIRKVIGGALYVNSASMVWHQGNDGAGSGLDADLWDGNQFSSYLNQGVLTTSSPTFGNIYCNDWLRNNGSGEGLYNTANDAHFYSAGSNYWHLNGNSGDINHGALILYDRHNSSHGNSTGRKGYLYWDSNGFGLLHSNGGWAVRTTSSATTLFGTLTHDGSTIWHAGNDGNGSGLDADKVDGIQAASFIRGDTNHSITYGSRWDLNHNVSGWGMRFNNSAGTNCYMYFCHSTHGFHVRNDNAGTNYIFDAYPSGGQRFQVRGTDGLVTSNGNTMWHAGNDGSGSGLNADQLDGTEASGFVKQDNNSFHVLRFGSGSNSGHTRTSYPYAIFQETGAWSTPYPDLCINYHTGIKIGCGHQNYGGLRFTPDYNSETILMSINNGTESNGSGNVLVNTNLYCDAWLRNNDSGEGVYNHSTTQHFYSDHDDCWNVAGGSGGNWIRFRDENAGTLRGYVGANNSSLVGFLDIDGNWAFSSNKFTNYSYRDLACSPDGNHDLGYGNRRWDNVYATNGTIQTSDRNEKENIVATDLGLDFVNKLSPVSFKRKGKTRTHYGFIAQDIEQIITDLGKTTTQFAPLIKSDISEAKDGSEYRYGLRYEQLLAPVVKSIQELSDKVTELATKVAALESA